jgi:hypothetical protein
MFLFISKTYSLAFVSVLAVRRPFTFSVREGGVPSGRNPGVSWCSSYEWNDSKNNKDEETGKLHCDCSLYPDPSWLLRIGILTI